MRKLQNIPSNVGQMIVTASLMINNNDKYSLYWNLVCLLSLPSTNLPGSNSKHIPTWWASRTIVKIPLGVYTGGFETHFLIHRPATAYPERQ